MEIQAIRRAVPLDWRGLGEGRAPVARLPLVPVPDLDLLRQRVWLLHSARLPVVAEAGKWSGSVCRAIVAVWSQQLLNLCQRFNVVVVRIRAAVKASKKMRHIALKEI
ncbi:hypothetical protein [Tahibacter aquaticus]|jgi:hypothetical protein|uniref:hypothetical protein n=1 Tax=Tahibacter aquaticus TaxID=520092 RepID=UPI00105F2443|nr:hypothetical protein [Tahibacter aquaticus]